MLHVRVCVFSDGGGAIKSRRAKVAYSYTAESPDELSLQPGQVIKTWLFYAGLLMFITV